MSVLLEVSHNAESAHRLPFIGGKCMNIHGHSWGLTFQIDGEIDADSVIADFSVVKKIVRNWVDEHLDHGAMLGVGDPLCEVFLKHGSKTFVFGVDTPYPWPTVEAVALMLAEEIQPRLVDTFPGLAILEVRVQETAVNAAIWRRDVPVIRSRSEPPRVGIADRQEEPV